MSSGISAGEEISAFGQWWDIEAPVSLLDID